MLIKTLGPWPAVLLLVTGCSAAPRPVNPVDSMFGGDPATPAGESDPATPDARGFSAVAELVDERLAARVHWFQGTEEDAAVAASVGALLAGELTADAAVQIALLNHRGLQAEYEVLGVAQADLVQAGLLENPVFAAGARFPDRPPSAANLELGVAQSFLDLLVRPARRELAARELEETQLRVGAAVLDLAADVRAAFYTLQGSRQAAAALAVVDGAAESAAELASRQHAAGNLNDLDLAGYDALREEARLDLAGAEAAAAEGRERLSRLLGLWDDEGWTIAAALPELPAAEPDLAHLEQSALARRLDLAAARVEVDKLARALEITVRWRWIALAEIGVDRERDTDGQTVTGPTLAVQLPVFDRGQGRVARHEAFLRRGRQRLAQRALEIRSEVRAARRRLLASRQLAERYRDVLIPLRQRIVAEAQRHYNFMLIGVYQVLEARRDEAAAYRDYLDAVRDYWLARAELERAVGAALTAPPAAIVPEAAVPEETHHDHHH
ncbi:MAG TPA: TolC family protein [Thermoanaerobaculia bacterium]